MPNTNKSKKTKTPLGDLTMEELKSIITEVVTPLLEQNKITSIQQTVEMMSVKIIDVVDPLWNTINDVDAQQEINTKSIAHNKANIKSHYHEPIVHNV